MGQDIDLIFPVLDGNEGLFYRVSRQENGLRLVGMDARQTFRWALGFSSGTTIGQDGAMIG